MAAKILLRPVAELRAHPGNARVHGAAQIEQINASMLACADGTMSESQQIVLLQTFAQRIRVTRPMLVNDELGAFPTSSRRSAAAPPS